MTASTLNAQDIARYFLANVDEEGGDNITNLKLQKLLYYAQGFHVAMHAGEPLFPESIVAWKHGPVVISIYHHYKANRWEPISRPSDFEINDYPPEVVELLREIYSLYGQFTATRLETMTHNEPPWINTSPTRVITLGSLKKFFSTLVEAGRKGQSVLGEPVWPTNSFRFQGRRALSKRMAVHRGRLEAIAREAPTGADWA